MSYICYTNQLNEYTGAMCLRIPSQTNSIQINVLYHKTSLVALRIKTVSVLFTLQSLAGYSHLVTVYKMHLVVCHNTVKCRECLEIPVVKRLAVLMFCDHNE